MSSFRLEDVSVSAKIIEVPITERIARLAYSKPSQPRCDGVDGHCYGCDSAEPKPLQRDIYPIRAAA